MASLAAKILGVDSTSQLGRLSILMWQARSAKESPAHRITESHIARTAYWIAQLPLLESETVEYLPGLASTAINDRSYEKKLWFERELQNEMRTTPVLNEVLLDNKPSVRRMPDDVIEILDAAITDDQLIPQQKAALRDLIMWFGNYTDGFGREKLAKLLDRLPALNV